MNPNDIVGIVERIAELLTPGAQQAWDIAVRQARAQSIAYLVWSIICTAGAILAVILLKKVFRKMSDPTSVWGGGDGSEAVGTTLGLIVAIVSLLAIAGTNINNAILYLANPEYQAIKLLLGLVGQ